MYGMTTVACSMNFPVDGFGFLLIFCWGFLVERTVLGSHRCSSRRCEVLIVFHIERPSEGGVPLGWEDGAMWLFQWCVRFEKFAEYWRDSNIGSVSVERQIFDTNVKYFTCWMVLGVASPVYYCEIFKFCFWVFCRDSVVFDGTRGWISMFCNSFFDFTYVLSCAVVGWAFYW